MSKDQKQKGLVYITLILNVLLLFASSVINDSNLLASISIIALVLMAIIGLYFIYLYKKS